MIFYEKVIAYDYGFRVRNERERRRELNITIENENGNIVYSSTTNTSLRLVYMIPINNLPTGNYNIIIENNDGSAEASFRIEK